MSLPDIIGHRGARALFAENTLPGFAATAALGCHHLEVDVAMTADGVCVLSHDPCLSPDLTRSACGDWLRWPRPQISLMTLAELRRFHVGHARPGSRTARRYPRQAGFDNTPVPTLEEALLQHPTLRWTIEVKSYFNRPRLTPPPEVMTNAVLGVIARTGATARCIIQSFDWRIVRLAAQADPALARAWLTARATRSWHGGQRHLPHSIADEGGGTWAPRYLELSERLVIKAKALGLRVVPWTVNSPYAIRRLAKWGVDGIITDDPVMAADALRPSGIGTP